MSTITSLIADPDKAAQRGKMACLLTRLFNGDVDPAELFTLMGLQQIISLVSG